MPIRRVLKSRSHGRLADCAASVLSQEPEKILIVPSVEAGNRFAHSLPGGTLGLHRISLISWAAQLSQEHLAENDLTPVGGLGLQAVVARALHEANQAGELRYFAPVSEFPGFAKALARTIQELRLASVLPTQLRETGEAGADLANLLARYEAELQSARLADLAQMLAFGGRAARTGSRRALMGLPIVALDALLETAAPQDFFRAVAQQSPSVVAAVSWDAETYEEILGVSAEDLDDPWDTSTLTRLRRGLFSPETLTGKNGGKPEETGEPTGDAFEIFSAPGEGLEAVEIARRIKKLASEGKPFDQLAVLLRSVERYQPLLEEAFRRARIPAYFSRGSLRPSPAGRAFLALLECAAEKCSASRFAEYLSLSQVPAKDAAPHEEWIGPQDEVLGQDLGGQSSGDAAGSADAQEHGDALRLPARWEKLLMDAAVIGGSDRWERRLRGPRKSWNSASPRRNAKTRRNERAWNGSANNCVNWNCSRFPSSSSSPLCRLRQCGVSGWSNWNGWRGARCARLRWS